MARQALRKDIPAPLIPAGDAAQQEVQPRLPASNEAFATIARLAAAAAGTDRAFISFAVHGRDMILAQHGMDGPLQPIDTLLPPHLVAVTETTVWQATLASPADSGIAFALVLPIRDGAGDRIGQLSLVDDAPGILALDSAELAVLEDLAGLAGLTRSGLASDAARSSTERALQESEEHYRHFIALSPQIPWTATPDGAIDEVGPKWREITGLNLDQARGGGWIGVLHPTDVEATLDQWSNALQARVPVDVDYRVRTHDGSYRWMRARAAPRLDESGAIVRWYGTLEDIHEGKLAKEALIESEERLRLAIESAQLGIWDYDGATGRREWSDQFKIMLGLPVDVEPTIEQAFAVVHPDDRWHLHAIIDAVHTREAPRHFETALRIRRANDGAERWIKTTGWKTMSGNSEVGRVIVTFRDVTDERNAEERVRWAATHDPLTRLPNRTQLQDSLEMIAGRALKEGSRFGVLLLDVDDLKRTNDTLGHDAGDALLRTFAARLSVIGPHDSVIGRLGGDEFAIIIPGIGTVEALQDCATGLLHALREPFMYDGRMLDCAASIGASVFPLHGECAEDLLKSADLALYAAKATGRGRVKTFQPEMRADMQRRASAISMAREAIDSELIVPFYQPKVDLTNGRVIGYEALLRWEHPRRGIQLPETIAAAFEDPDLAIAITDRMLERVTADMRQWIDAGWNPGPIALNASAADFKYDDLAERVLNRLEQCNLPTSLLEIEVTETVFLGRGAAYAERALKLFSREGIRIALDDFGTGYASLSHLKQYPVDILKIDRSFVTSLEDSQDDAVIVDAVVELGRSLGLTVVAEGVETREQADYLRRRGCGVGQGYLFGHPQRAKQIESGWQSLPGIFNFRV